MGRIIFEYAPGSTSQDPDETVGLIPDHVVTQSQLNEWEQNNILDSEKWMIGRQFDFTDIMTVDFIKTLHIKMFSRTWKWAGKFRRTNKNIGFDWPIISVELKYLLDDIIYLTENKTYAVNEIAARFHCRLAAVHPFPNGNGRHARLMTDIFLLSQNQKRFTWGNAELMSATSMRKEYISALQAGDKGNYQPLINFLMQ